MSMRSYSRRRLQRRRRQKTANWGVRALVIFLICASLLFITAIVIGLSLGRAAADPDGSSEEGTVKTSPPPAGRFRKDAVPFVTARYLDHAAYMTPASGYRGPDPEPDGAVSLLLRTPAGEEDPSETSDGGVKTGTGMRLLYRSPVSASKSFDIIDGPELSTLTAALKNEYRYLSGVFETSYAKEIISSRLIMKEYEISLVCELAESGFDEIVITGVGEDERSLSEAVSFIREIGERTGGAVSVGLALGLDFYDSPDARSAINSLGFDCGFLAVDLTSLEIPSLMTPETVIRDRTERISEITGLYGLRVIVGCGDEEGFDGEIAAARSAGALNVQSVKKKADQSEQINNEKENGGAVTGSP